MKKITPHHTLTPKGGRVASRVTRHAFKTMARASSTAGGPGAAPRKDFYRAAFRKLIARTASKEA